jgi:hypothetical protein
MDDRIARRNLEKKGLESHFGIKSLAGIGIAKGGRVLFLEPKRPSRGSFNE